MQKLDFSQIDLNLLKLLDALLIERSVTRAGQRIGLSQPAASRGLGRLRRLFNDPLLIRSAQGLELTPKAIDLSEPVAKLLENARIIIEPSTFTPDTASGKFVIAVADHLALLFMPKLLNELTHTAPGLDIEIPALSGNNVELITQGDADIAIGVYDKLPTRLYQRALYEEDLVCVVRREHPLVNNTLTLEQFISLKHISIIITGQGGNAIDDMLATQGLKRRVAVRLPHFLTAPMLIANSDMILSLPRRLAQKMATLVPIKIFELPLEISPFTPSMIWHGRQHNNPAHIWLRKKIMETGTSLIHEDNE